MVVRLYHNNEGKSFLKENRGPVFGTSTRNKEKKTVEGTFDSRLG